MRRFHSSLVTEWQAGRGHLRGKLRPNHVLVARRVVGRRLELDATVRLPADFSAFHCAHKVIVRRYEALSSTRFGFGAAFPVSGGL
jgi:hypothetical protein